MQFLRSSRVLFALIGALAAVPMASAQAPEAKPAAPATPAAQPAADLPTGEALFLKHIEAVGGLEGLKAQKSAMVKGRITRVGASSGLLTMWRKAPDKMYKIVDFPGLVTVETWCDGQHAWVRDSNKGVARMEGEALEDTKLESEFIGEADYKARYKELKTTEKTTLAGRPAYAVAATTTSGKARTLFFDAEKGFLIGFKFTVPSPQGDVPVAVTFTDYKKFGSAWQPTSVVEEVGTSKTTTTFTQIEMDITAMPSIDPPDEIKNLKK